MVTATATPLPTVLLCEQREQRQKGQLPGCVRGAEQPHCQTAPRHKPAICDYRRYTDGAATGADPDHQAPSNEELPRRGHKERQARAGCQ